MFNTELIVTWAPNNTGVPDDANPAYNPIADLSNTKLQEMKSADLLGSISVSGYITTYKFANRQAAQDFQTFLTEILIDFNQLIPEFSIVDVS